jgi:hypothetical protein
MVWEVQCDCVLTKEEMEEIIKCVPDISRINFRRHPGSEEEMYCLSGGVESDVYMRSIRELTEFYFEVTFGGDKMIIHT